MFLRIFLILPSPLNIHQQPGVKKTAGQTASDLPQCRLLQGDQPTGHLGGPPEIQVEPAFAAQSKKIIPVQTVFTWDVFTLPLLLSPIFNSSLKLGLLDFLSRKVQ